MDQSQSQRVVRIVTKDLPRYFATVTRCRLETATIGPAGAVLRSSVDPQVQAVFPEGALMKSIKVGLQVTNSDYCYWQNVHNLWGKIVVNAD